MAELPSDLVPYVYSYLVGLNLHKAAKALKKESAVSVQVASGPGLVDFYQQYLRSQCGQRASTLTNNEAPPNRKRKRVAESPPVIDETTFVEESAVIASPTVTEELEEELTTDYTGDPQPKTPATFPLIKKKSKKNKQLSEVATPFRRVGNEIAVDPRLEDNSFEAKGGSRGSWGEKANRDLKFTKGRSFRHEKTKKKRGSYKGGAIDTQVYSIKFDEN